MTELAFLSAKNLAAKLRARELSCVELLDYFVTRHRKYHGALNAIIWTDLKDESRVAHPEELPVALSHQSDAVSLGKTSADRPANLTVPVQRHELPRVKSDDFPGTCRHDPVVGP